MTQNTSTTRGTDEAFLKLMEVSGTSVLKLFGFSAEQADKYHFRAVVFKDKRVEPDVEGVPILESKDKRVFIEFQGYTDKFIRYRLLSEILLGCQADQYEDQVLAGIVYTENKFQQAALPIQAFEATDCQLKGCIKEIVLTDYTEEQLRNIDPKLIVLAPFTLPSKADKITLIEKSQQWYQAVNQLFSIDQQQTVLNVLGLFILNRFRDISDKEVMAMLHFDLMDTVAGRQVYEKGLIEDARNMVAIALEERFEMVPSQIIEQIRAITHHDVLESLFRYALRCSGISGFNEILSKKRLIITLEERFGHVPSLIVDQIRAINHQEVLDHLLQQAKQCPDIDCFKKILLKTIESV
jgi:hypothetical protein